MIRSKPQFIVLLVAAALLSACATAPTPPPVEDGAASAPVIRDSTEPQSPQDQPAPRATAATTALLAAAEEARAERDYNNAITYLERAVRIDPRNADLWVALSEAHLANSDLTAANQHIRKAIALAGDNPVQRQRAWLQLASIREAEGNLSEARAIRKRYQSVSG